MRTKIVPKEKIRAVLDSYQTKMAILDVDKKQKRDHRKNIQQKK